ncbi:sporulation integral membrane protein YlbJ [Scopulibacillus darangshiensis]|uniref:sporulation integral membrane protein YlbJ n=1 Tax=Scopulibacillus darangshiensis TaxID=442528 RepID=UPI0010527CF4|nr:sporulation integral membrane protein YlbJ [Scopulibacillus darangshiensis]
MNASKVKTYVLALSALFIAAAIVAFPKVSVDASLKGLTLWWNVVFPSLLPFFIVAELLIGFGIVTFIGVLFEPIMRPIFKVPGVGGFVFVMGLVSGFPAGAKFSARLYEEKKLTKTEAERLASFTNFSNPLFLFGVVAYEFFHHPALGIVFALAHYLGNICVGLIMRFYKPHEADESNGKDTKRLFYGKVIIDALRKMHEERLKNRKPVGKMLGDAVQSSVSTLLMVGGFIILFSVLNQLLASLNGTEIIGFLIQYIFAFVHFTPELSQAIVPGLFEITVGADKISSVSAPLIEQVILTSFILGFSGLSIQAQVTSILSESNLSAKPFFIGRFFHGTFAAIFAYFLFQLVDIDTIGSRNAIPVFGFFEHHQTLMSFVPYLQAGSIITLTTLIIYILSKAVVISKQNPR